MDSPLHVEPRKLASPFGVERQYEYSFSTTLEIGGQFVCVRDDSIAVLGASAKTNLVRFKWLDNHNLYLRKMGFPKVTP